jgi:N-acetylglucosaminyldiphosphoundecaprenol N-acetyl-beta-D-mannosaminyltransferase
MSTYRTILGINYFVGTLEELLVLSRKGGLIVVPAAPNLADLRVHPAYREAVEGATFAITDSSLLIIMWFMRKGEWLTKISGLKYLRALIAEQSFRDARTFWVMPSREDMLVNLRWLAGAGIRPQEQDCYIAPFYPKGHFTDELLLAKIEAQRPEYIILNIGGGIQEVLGQFLHSRLSYRPTIVCTGAAIAFLSGRQARIPPWVEQLMMAWLARCLHEPKKFIPRYLRGFRLIWVFFRHVEASVAPRP